MKLICVNNGMYYASLTLGKWYTTIQDKDAENVDCIRIIDDTDEDYLYPVEWFKTESEVIKEFNLKEWL